MEQIKPHYLNGVLGHATARSRLQASSRAALLLLLLIIFCQQSASHHTRSRQGPLEHISSTLATALYTQHTNTRKTCIM
jgi:hypothetical protein